MVTRKPVGPSVDTDTNTSPPANANPPYPTTPTTSTELDRSKTIHSAQSVYSPDLATSPAFDLIDMHQARTKRRDSDVSSHGTWDTDGEDDERRETPEEADIPKPLRLSRAQQDVQAEEPKKDELPAALRPGPANGAAPRGKSQEVLRDEDEASANPWAATAIAQHPVNPPASNNPYRQPNGTAPETSQAAWSSQQSVPSQPVNAPPAPPVELPAVQTPSDELAHMSLGNASFETAEVLAVPQLGSGPLPPVVNQDRPEEDIFGTNNPWQMPSQDNPENVAIPPGPPPKAPLQSDAEPQYAPPPGPPPMSAPMASLMDQEPTSQQSFEHHRPAPISTSLPDASRSTDSVPETPQTRDRRQRSENYQIKHVNWFDASYTLDPRFKDAMRRSPILTQNANGPCPLLALVNALVLSTPQNVDSALIETLRTREQVSLGLLLDAVFEELMSGRRGNNAEHLPDVGELYAFLLALHTGMNVNPRFVTPAYAPRGSLDSPPPEKASLHPVERAQSKAGCFEETKEMRLYSTFTIPLIHGWTAPSDTAAYAAFERSAQTFDDWLIVQFREEELEAKLQSEGLNPDEQQLLQDIQTIKSFLSTWPTQLTDYGLETISASLRPGQFAILFRNDHFSTIYKETNHGALMTLVTDTGYSSHEEIVWESLVDVNGAASELFSGDFRAVSHEQDVTRLNTGNTGGGEDNWETARNKSRYRPHNQQSQNRQGPLRLANGTAGDGHETPPALPGPRPGSSTAAVPMEEILGVQPDTQQKSIEQEDHDLALALQLQEEEEDQHRQAEERRRRERELSERFLSSESTPDGPRPPIPPRRSGNRASAGPTPSGRAPVTRQGDDPDAPPSYEQSASDRPYRPAGSTPASGLQQGNPLNAYDALRRQQSAYAANSSTTVNSMGSAGPEAHNRRQSQGAGRRGRRASQFGVDGPPPVGRPQQGVSGAPGVRETEDKCAVM